MSGVQRRAHGHPGWIRRKANSARAPVARLVSVVRVGGLAAGLTSVLRLLPDPARWNGSAIDGEEDVPCGKEPSYGMKCDSGRD